MGEPEPVDQDAGVREHNRLTGPAWRCRLAPGVRLRSVADRAFIVSERPLAVVEVRPRGRRLLAGLPPGEEVLLAGPGPAELRFLRRLAAVGLVELQPVPTTWPSITVVVPVRDRPAELAGCLESVARVRYPGSMEVLVVDDASEEPVTVPVGVRLVRLPRSVGPGSARNAGAAACGTELLAFLDSDCVAEPNWLDTLVPELADPAVAAAGGRILPAAERGWLERYEAVRSPLDLGSGPASARPQAPVPYLVTASLVVRRGAFEAVGGFDPALRCGEDVDLCYRLSAAGHRLVYRPASQVRHWHRATPLAFARTRATYATTEAPLLRRHPGGRRWLGFSPGIAAAAVGALGALLSSPRLLLAGGLALGLEMTTNVEKLGRLGVPVASAAPALMRGHGIGLYHVARQLARYYGLPAALLALAAGRRHRRRLLLALAAAELVPAVIDWRRLRPRLSLPRFVAAWLLDDAAYQAGLLLGCLRERSAAPLGLELRLLDGRQRWEEP